MYKTKMLRVKYSLLFLQFPRHEIQTDSEFVVLRELYSPSYQLFGNSPSPKLVNTSLDGGAGVNIVDYPSTVCNNTHKYIIIHVSDM